MWWDHQNLSKSRTTKDGEAWHFRVWHDVVASSHVARVFFWNDDRTATGVIIVPPGARTDVTAIRSLVQKLAADPELRALHLRELRFPLERHYSQYGVFPEEKTVGAVESQR